MGMHLRSTDHEAVVASRSMFIGRFARRVRIRHVRSRSGVVSEPRSAVATEVGALADPRRPIGAIAIRERSAQR